MALGGSLAGVAKVVLRVDDTQFQRDLTRDQAQFRQKTSEMTRDTEKMSRGVLAGSGAFHNLGRSIAFASGAFLGAAGFAQVVRSSISAAEDLGKATRGLDAQLRANNQSVSAAAPLIARLDERMAGFGYTATQTNTALARLSRATGDVVRAADLMGVAADLAAAKHITLEQAALLVGKVVDGNVSALNRYGIFVAKGTSVTDALTIAQQRLAGQAAASVTPMEKMHAAVTNLEAGLGEALLPTINKIAGALGEWASNTQNQERVTKDVKEAVHDATAVFDAFKTVVGDVDGVTGGLKHTLELLLGLKMAFVVSGWSTAFGKLIGVEAAAGATGTGIAGASGAASLLRLRLLSLAKIGPIAIPIALQMVAPHFTEDLRGILATPGNALLKALDGVLGTNLFGAAGYHPNAKSGGAGGGGLVTRPGASSFTGTNPAVSAAIVNTAKGSLGIPYQYGGAPSLSKPTDCSGLMVAVFAKNGISLPRTSQSQYESAPIKNARPLLPGDLVFAEGVHPGHVGLYIGNNQVLEDPHTGDHVKIVALSGFGWNGESARWWGGTKSVGSGGAGASGGIGAGTGTGGTGAAAKTKKGSPTDLPGSTDESIASTSRSFDAHPTIKNMQAFVAAQNTAIDDLTKKLNNTTNHKVRAQLIDAIAQHETAIRDAYSKMKKTAPKKGDITDLPERYDDAVTLAQNTLGTQGLNMVITAESKAIDALNARLKKAHGENRVKLQIAIRERQNTIRDARSQLATIATGKFTTGLGKETSTVTGIVAGIKSAVASVTAGDQVVDITDSKGNITGRQFAGTTQVVYDPKSGKYVVQSIKPSIDAMKKELADLMGTTLPGLRGRIKKTKNAIAQLKAHNRGGKNNKKIAALNTHLTDLGNALSDAEDQATGLSNTIPELEAELQLPTNKEASFTPEGLFPSSLLLGGAQADLAGDRGAQLGVLGQEEGILRGALASGGYSTEDQISITQALTGIVGQESSINSGIAADAKSAADDAAAARSSYLDSLISLPTGLRLSAAYSGLGGGTNQQGAVQAELDYVKAQQAMLEGMTQSADVQEHLISLLGTRSSLESELNQLVQQANDLQAKAVELQDAKNQAQAEENAALISYLQARYTLTRTYGDTVFSRTLAGATVNLNNTFANVPEDPHLYSQNLAFELKALS